MTRLAGDRSRALVRLALLLALALALSLVESLVLPPFGVPGAKWGLANIVSLLVLMQFGFRAAGVVVALRVVMAAIFSGTFLGLGFLLSAAGAVMALLMMTVFLKIGGFGILGVSVAGAMTHNLAQLGVYALVIGSAGGFYLLPPLILVAVLTGTLTGIVAKKLSQY